MTSAAGAPSSGPFATLLVEGIGQLVACDGTGAHGLGVIDDAAVLIDGARIAWCGPRVDLPRFLAGRSMVDVPVLDVGGRCVVPGLVDCHTHLIFRGDRADEFARRARGETYAQIMAAGGGIRSTMRAVRGATVDDLVADALPRLDACLARGVTTVEVKSGYGLDVDSELRMLEAARALDDRHAITVVPTLLAAHAVPPEHDGAPSAWIDVIVRDLLPEVARRRLATACDVFVEQGAFSVDDGRRLLRRAQELGLQAKVHAEQLSHGGGAVLAAEIGAVAAGHLEHATAADAEALARAGVVCEVLALAQVFLRGQRAIPGRLLADAGCKLAVATDFNPGTAMSSDLPLAAGLAVTQCGLTAEEALLGMTAHAAAALGLDDRGVLAAGKRADLVVLERAVGGRGSPYDLVYRWSERLARTVIVGGAVELDSTGVAPTPDARGAP
jgi:imidazolonepropionase